MIKQCDICGKDIEYTKEEDDAAIEEFHKKYPGKDINDTGILCDDCYHMALRLIPIDTVMRAW